MRLSNFKSVPWIVLLVPGAVGQHIVYVTNLKIFSSLAPCAASAISLHVMSQTSSNCPQGVTDLQECVCTTRNNQLESLSSAMSRSVSDNCGSTAIEDQTSAASVLSAYCNQKTPSAMPTLRAPEFPVSEYITDMVAIEQLAPCASSAIAYAVQSMSNTLCPREATGLATCACQKQQYSQRISQSISSDIRFSCASHSADITSAQDLFSAYCRLAVSGTSAFPVASAPPGNMSYYVTALPQFKSLASCAQNAVSSAIHSQTSMYCPRGVQALASCVCIKESMSRSLSSSITSSVKAYCSTTASQDLTSALSVFDFYCSAARGEVKATGVSESIAQSYPSAQTGSISRQPGAGQSGGAGQNGSGSIGGPNTGIIAGAVVGGVVLLVLIGVAAFFLMRRARLNSAAASRPYGTPASPEHHYKPELDARHMGQIPLSQSPVGDKHLSELYGAGNIVSPLSAAPATSELHGNDSPVSPQTAGYGTSTNMAWKSGPISEYSELDGSNHGRG